MEEEEGNGGFDGTNTGVSDPGRPNRVRKIKIYEQPQVESTESADTKKKKKKISKGTIPTEELTPKKSSNLNSSLANISSNASASSESIGVSSSSKSATKIGTEGQHSSFHNSQLKRPRGRPPLSTSNKKPSTNLSGNGGVSAPLTPNNSKSGQLFTDDGNGTILAPNTTNSRMPRPPYPVVVSKVLTKLMTSDPISINDLCKILSDCPRDMIQSSLDVMQIMGVAMQQKAKDGYRKEYTTGTAVYSLVHFAKAPHAVGLEKLEEDTATKQDVAEKSKKRVELLYELSEKNNLTVEQRTEEFKALMSKFQQEDPHIVENPMYITLFEALGLSF